MNELIKIEVREDDFKVDSRQLYDFLGSKQKYTDWIDNRLFGYQFREGFDYVSETEKRKGRGRRKVTYFLTIDAAKHLAMIENNDKGRVARDYFIDAEKDLKKMIKHVGPQVTADAGVLASKYEASVRIIDSVCKVGELLGNTAAVSRSNAVQVVRREIPEIDYQNLLGQNVDEEGLLVTPTEIGRTIVPSMTAVSVNLALEAHGLQVKIDKRWEPTRKALDEKYCQWLSVAKQHSDGTPVNQLKWYKDKTVSLLMGGEYNPVVHQNSQDLFSQEYA